MFFPNRITKIQPGDRVLEVGPGGLPHPRSDVFLELSLGEEELAAQRGHADELQTDKQVVYYDGGRFPFADGEFDYVICSHVVEHVPHPEQFAAELFRVAKAGYIEYPTIYYEYLYNYDVHLNVVARRDGVLHYMRKADLPFATFSPVQDFFRETQGQGYMAIIDDLVEYMIEGFEWTEPFRVEQAGELALVTPERPPVPAYRPSVPSPLWRRGISKLKRTLAGTQTGETMNTQSTTPTIDDYLQTPSEQEEILRLLYKPNADLTIFDIGACEGEDSVRYSRLYPRAKVYTFEPLPSNADKIAANFKKYGVDATLARVALSNQNGTAEFHVSSGKPDESQDTGDWDYGNKSSSLLAPDKTLEVHPWLKFEKKVTVKTETLAHYMAEHKIEGIDFIHMDVQGAELMVLEGAGAFIDQIKAVWLEVENIALYKNQPTKTSVEQFMATHGFVLVKSTVDDVAGDQFYVNTRFVSASRIARLRSVGSLRKLAGRVRRSPKTALKRVAHTILGKTVRIRLSTGERMLVNNGMAWAFQDGAYYEHNVEHWLRRVAQAIPGAVFYDIGANAGYYSLVISKLAKQVYAFEPGRTTRRQLLTNLGLNLRRNVQVMSYGLAKDSRTAEFNIYSSNGNNSLYERNIPEGHELRLLRKERVRLMSLDAARQQYHILPPSLMKIDVEGGELEALQGAVATLEQYAPVILFEYSAKTSEDAGYDRKELLRVLQPLGYHFYGLSEDPDDNTLYPLPKNLSNLSSPQIDNVLAVPERRVQELGKSLQLPGSKQ